MSVRDDLAELEQLAATAPETGSGDLAALDTIEAIYGFLIANSRADGGDEADAVELFARFSGATAADVRRIAGVLLPLGYVVAATRLREIAGKRQHSLRPLG
jgi:hypothetical protein